MTIVTHNGPFHADDVVAVGIIATLFSIPVIRSRDPEVIADADFAIDVGAAYDPSKGRFDHHQFRALDGEGPIRESGTPLASAGMVWSEYGHQYVRHVCIHQLEGTVGTWMELDRIVNIVDRDFIAPIDAGDVGYGERHPGSISGVIASMNPTWQEQGLQGASFDEDFPVAMEFARTALDRAILSAVASVMAESRVRDADRLFDGQVVKLESFVPWMGTELEPAVLYVIFPGPDGNGWRLQQVPKEPGSFEGRKPLPEEWAGERGEDLQKLAGLQKVGSSTFCHPGRFIAGAESSDDILRMAELALKA